VPGTKNGDTLGEASNLCKMESNHGSLRDNALSCTTQKRKNGPLSPSFDETRFV
jgi:hypothetical protein